jgi:hypothetical protein
LKLLLTGEKPGFIGRVNVDAPKILAIAEIEQQLGGNGTILEVGFGDSSFLRNLCDAGYSVTGTEISDWMVKETQANLPQATVVCTDDPSEIKGNFDAVCCFEVLEHLPDPMTLAANLPGNVLYGSVPDPLRWYPRLTGKYEYWDYPPNHLWRYCLCEPKAQDYHEPSCKLKDKIKSADGPDVMSLRWVLSQAGYEQVTIHQTHVQPQDLLRIIPIRRNSASYDQMRTKRGGLRLAISAAKKVLAPGTFMGSSALNIMGFHGVSYYFTASR